MFDSRKSDKFVVSLRRCYNSVQMREAPGFPAAGPETCRRVKVSSQVAEDVCSCNEPVTTAE